MTLASKAARALPWAAVLTPVLLALLWWLGPLTLELEANADTERDLLRTLGWVDHGLFPARGPRLDHLPASLPRTWYVLMSPFLAVHPSATTVHLVHAIAFAAALGVLLRALVPVLGAPITLLTGLVLALSRYSGAILAQVWHVGLLPTAVLLVLAALVHVATVEPHHQGRHLALAWLGTLLGLQAHVVAAALLPALLAATVTVAWTTLPTTRGRLLALTIPALCALVLVTTVLRELMAIDFNAIGPVLALRSAGRAAPGDLAQVSVELLGPAFVASLASRVVGALLVALAVGALGVVVVRRLRHVPLASAAPVPLVGTVALAGALAAAALGGLAVTVRYLGVVVPALLVLAGLGLAAVSARWPLRVRTAVPLASSVALLLVALLGLSGAASPQRVVAAPSLREQEALAVTLRDLGVGRFELAAATHGPIFGARSALMLAATVAELPAFGTVAHSGLVVAPDGFPLPPDLRPLRRLLVPGGRTWMVGTSARAATLGARARVEPGACPVSIPYRWSALDRDELAPFGIPAPVDLAACTSPSVEATLHVTLPAVTEARSGVVTVIVGWYDLARHGPDGCRVSAMTASGVTVPVHRIGADLFTDLGVFQLEPVPGQATHVTMTPSNTLAVLDVY